MCPLNIQRKPYENVHLHSLWGNMEGVVHSVIAMKEKRGREGGDEGGHKNIVVYRL